MGRREPRLVSRRAVQVLLQEPVSGGPSRLPRSRRAANDRRRRARAARVLGASAAARAGGSVTMYTLGINAAFHDSSACLVEDGRVVAAAEEERFTRIKHAKRPTPFAAYELPHHAIDFCLAQAKIELA